MKKNPFPKLNRQFFQRKKSTIEETGGDIIYRIYLDSYFVLNFWMNLWVLFLCKSILLKRLALGRLMGTAFLSTVLQCLVLLFPVGSSSIKLLAGFGGVMSLSIWLLFRPRTKAMWLKVLAAVCISAMLLGGALQLAANLFYGQNITPVEVLVLSGSFTLMVKILVGRYWKRKGDSFVRVELILPGGESFSFRALVDSGNSLREPISKKPVSLVEKQAVSGAKSGFWPSNFRPVPFHSVGRQGGLMEAYKIERMEIWQEGEVKVIAEPFIGLVEGVISAGKAYQMILHPALLENEEE
ncbi:MAG: sigma-E processing peptidase SpoIIGA [Lachnospiraceae bacterium]